MPNTTIASAEDWLIAGVKLFSREGIQGVRPVGFSRQMGSCEVDDFLLFFTNEQEYLRQMIGYWRDTHHISKGIETFGRVPVARRLDKLVDLVFADRSQHNFLFYLRKLGSTNQEVAKMLALIEEERKDAIRPLFNGLGFGCREIDLKVEILYSFYLGWYERNKTKKFSQALRAEVLEQLRHLVEVG